MLADLGSTPASNPIPAVLTASDAEADLMRSNGVGADGYLTEPPWPGDVVGVVRSFDPA